VTVLAVQGPRRPSGYRFVVGSGEISAIVAYRSADAVHDQFSMTLERTACRMFEDAESYVATRHVCAPTRASSLRVGDGMSSPCLARARRSFFDGRA